VALYAALGMPMPSSDELSKVRQDQAAYKAQISRGRDARFKVSVISGYHFTCALTGYRLIASKSTYVPPGGRAHPCPLQERAGYLR